MNRRLSMVAVNKRKKYLVDKSFQLRFIYKFCGIVVISSVAIGVLIFYFCGNSTTVAIENTKVFVKPTSDFILPVVVLTLLIVSFFSSAVIFFTALIATHRISGPLYRLRKDIDLLKSGNLKANFLVREKDELKDVARSLCGLNTAWRQTIEELKNKAGALNSLVKARGHGAVEDKEHIAALVKEINEILDYFKV
jgi:methyl-accepting chemotaxis protein